MLAGTLTGAEGSREDAGEWVWEREAISVAGMVPAAGRLQ